MLQNCSHFLCRTVSTQQHIEAGASQWGNRTPVTLQLPDYQAKCKQTSLAVCQPISTSRCVLTFTQALAEIVMGAQLTRALCALQNFTTYIRLPRMRPAGAPPGFGIYNRGNPPAPLVFLQLHLSLVKF